MSDVTFLSAGSNTTILTTPGRLYGVHVNDAAGAVVLIADSLNLGATPNYNVTTQTGLVERLGPMASAAPVAVNFHGMAVYDGLTISATSNAKVTVFTSR